MLEDLTAQERYIIDRIADGATNGDIAHELVLSNQRIKNIVRSCYEKLGFSGKGAREQLGAWGRRNRFPYEHPVAVIDERLNDDRSWDSYVYREARILAASLPKLEHYNRHALENGCVFERYEFRANVRALPQNSWQASIVPNPSERPNEIKIEFGFSPPLRKLSTIAYEYWQTFSGTPVTRQQAAASVDFNRYAAGRPAVRKNWRIVRPTARFIRRMFLPDWYRISAPTVWVYSDFTPVEDEIVRVGPKLVTQRQPGGTLLQLDIDDPKLNFLYSLEWEPLDD